VVLDLTSTPLEAAKGFYGGVLGLQPVMDQGWIVTLADPERPGAQISLMTHGATAPVIPGERQRHIPPPPARAPGSAPPSALVMTRAFHRPPQKIPSPPHPA
jgi:catechol 2,3-dioxygenase-like lactoylglutathione lyase family enzyme